MRLRTVLHCGVLAVCVAAGAVTGAAAQVWVDGAGRPCDLACNASGMAPVSSGNFTNGQPFYMCAGDALGEGYRGGFNLRPSWTNSCNVGAGGREVATTSYSCLCAATAAAKPLGPVQPGPQYSAPPAQIVVQEQPPGGRRINIDEATFGLNLGLPRGNATAHVTRWCDRARDVCDYTVDPAAFGGAGETPSDFTVRYHCGDDGRPKVAQTNVRGVMGQLILSCP